MSEDIADTIVKKTLLDSKLYALIKNEGLFDKLAPDLPTQMTVATDIEENFPRTEDDGDDTRILINYNNLKNNSVLYNLSDHERLYRAFDIDDFMNGFVQAVGNDTSDTSVVSWVPTILLALNGAVTTSLGFNDGEGVSQGTKAISETVVKSLVAILFDDALDVVIAVNEMPIRPDQTQTESMVVGAWIVKQRS